MTRTDAQNTLFGATGTHPRVPSGTVTQSGDPCLDPAARVKPPSANRTAPRLTLECREHKVLFPRSVHSAATGCFYSLSAARCRYMAAVQENAEPPSGSPVSGWKYSAKPVRSTNARLS